MELSSLQWLHDREVMERVGSALERLTPREQEILSRMLECVENREIARELRISRKTVGIHRSNLMAKVGAQSTSALVARVLAYQYQMALDATAQHAGFVGSWQSRTNVTSARGRR
jgi:DNA-binding NarL/FixJ family response regulator